MKSFFNGRSAFALCSALASLALHAQTLPYLDEQFSCIDPVVARRYIKDFNISIKSFGGKEYCNPKSDSKRILSDISLIEKGRFEPVDEKNIFINQFVDREHYYDWMKRETRGMKRGNGMPYASAYNSWGYFTFQDGWAQSSTLGRVGTIIHEARHTAGYKHTICTQGPYVKTRVSGCDEALSDGGSHGVEMEYYARVVLEGRNFHPVYAAMARLMVLGRSNAFFNSIPMQKKEILALHSRDGKMIVFDGHSVIERNSTQGLGLENVLKKTSFGVTLLSSTLLPMAVDLYSDRHGSAVMNDAYSYFKMLFRGDAEKMNFLDMEEYDIGDQRFLVALNRSREIFSYTFADGEWSDPVKLTGSPMKFVQTAPDFSTGVFVLDESGKVFPYDASLKTVQAPLKTEWNFAEVSAYVSWNHSQYILSKVDGHLYEVNQQTNELQRVPELADYSFSDVTVAPMYDAFRIEQ